MRHAHTHTFVRKHKGSTNAQEGVCLCGPMDTQARIQHSACMRVLVMVPVGTIDPIRFASFLLMLQRNFARMPYHIAPKYVLC
jgi:hypothetical protein